MRNTKALLLLACIAVALALAACGQRDIERSLPKPDPPPRPDQPSHRLVAAGNEHNLVVTDDGTLKAWGNNMYGQLGDGTTTSSPVAVDVTGITDVISVHAYASASVALKDDGTVWEWGYHAMGPAKHIPTQVPGLSGIVQVDTSGAHSLALDDDGGVWAWGSNGAGQLGDGTREYREAPVRVPVLTDVVQVLASGNGISLALKADGTVLMWGRHRGFGAGQDPQVPTPVPGVSGVVAMAAGGYTVSNVDVFYVVALTEDGEVWYWNHGSYERQDDATYVFTAALLPSFGGVTDITMGLSGFILALLDDGTVWTWGSGYSGNGDAYSSLPNPTQVASLQDIVSVHAGTSHALVVDSTGNMWAWGQNNYGQLGDGTTEPRFVPVPVTALEGAP